jgi:hypothetical protein
MAANNLDFFNECLEGIVVISLLIDSLIVLVFTPKLYENASA